VTAGYADSGKRIDQRAHAGVGRRWCTALMGGVGGHFGFWNCDFGS